MQAYLLSVEKRCTRKLTSWRREELYTFGKRDLSSGIQGVDFGCTKSKVKGKSQAGGLGTGCRSKRPNQDKLLCLCLLSFLRLFPFVQVYILTLIILCFNICIDIF